MEYTYIINVLPENNNIISPIVKFVCQVCGPRSENTGHGFRKISHDHPLENLGIEFVTYRARNGL